MSQNREQTINLDNIPDIELENKKKFHLAIGTNAE